MNILIISVTSHDFQLIEDEADNAEYRAMKLALRELLQVHLNEKVVTKILEEHSPVKMTIARQLASRNCPAVPWHSINMTDEERKNAGIFDAYNDRTEYLIFNGPMPCRVLERIPEDDIREDFFISRIIEENHNNGEIVVLLGNMHVLQVAQKLQALGQNVMSHELIPNE